MRRSLSWPQLADPFPSLDMEEEVARKEQQDGGAASGYTAYSYSYSKDHTKVLYTLSPAAGPRCTGRQSTALTGAGCS